MAAELSCCSQQLLLQDTPMALIHSTGFPGSLHHCSQPQWEAGVPNCTKAHQSWITALPLA